MKGGVIVLRVRLDRLKRAIEARDWEETERQYDRVLRATRKLKGHPPTHERRRP